MQPFILRNFLNDQNWPPMHLWTDEYMCERFSRDRKPKVRFGQKHRQQGEILHDNESIYHEFTNFAEMLQWMKGEHGLEDYTTSTSTSIKSSTNSMDTITPVTHWAYLDYKDILELLDEADAKQVNWIQLGVIKNKESEEQSWIDSTLWIGTPGAYTPCHYDTYGFNLHAQIRGYKRWLLFPPSTDLWPTRLPYEESSVFSSLDVLSSPDADLRLRGIKPHVVIAGPGDLLFVPPRWWHSVKIVANPNRNMHQHDNQDQLSISVNKWVLIDEDKRESAKEALLKFMMALHTNSSILNQYQHICLSEQESVQDLNELAEFVQFRLDKYAIETIDQDIQKSDYNASTTLEETSSKKPRLDLEERKTDVIRSSWQTSLDFFYVKFSNHERAVSIPAVVWDELNKEENKEQKFLSFQRKENAFLNQFDEVGLSPSENLKMELLEAMNSTEVLETLLNVFMEKRKKREKQRYVNAAALHRSA